MSISVGRDWPTEPRNSWRGSPRPASRWLAMPLVGSRISSHRMPIATGVASSGMIRTVRTQRMPRNGLRMSIASASPNTVSRTTAPTVKTIVRRTAGQKRRASPSASAKLRRPMWLLSAFTAPNASVRLRSSVKASGKTIIRPTKSSAGASIAHFRRRLACSKVRGGRVRRAPPLTGRASARDGETSVAVIGTPCGGCRGRGNRRTPRPRPVRRAERTRRECPRRAGARRCPGPGRPGEHGGGHSPDPASR